MLLQKSMNRFLPHLKTIAKCVNKMIVRRLIWQKMLNMKIHKRSSQKYKQTIGRIFALCACDTA